GWYLVTALKPLEVLLAPSALRNEPVGLRIGDVAGEREVEPEPRLVDEVVHVGLVAAVVIAAEEATPALIEKHPMGEMDGANAPEPAAREYVPRRPVDSVEDDELERGAEPARLDRTHRGVLIGDVVILAEAQ